MKLYKDIFKTSLWIAAVLIACKFSHSYVLLLVAIVGVVAAMMKKVALAWACWVLLVFSVTLSNFVVPKAGIIIALTLRLGPLIIAMATVIVASSGNGKKQLPLGLLMLYLLSQVVSSINGLVPQVSFMKLFQFVAFFSGLWIGGRTISTNEKELYKVRVFFLSIITVLIVGSILAYPFPEISYSTTLREESRMGAEHAKYAYERMASSGGLMLFSGITDHSQTLAPFMAIMIIYVFIDMIFIEQRISKLHSTLLASMLVILFMTRSRTGLFAVVLSFAVIFGYVFNKIQVPRTVKAKLTKWMAVGGVLLFCGGVAMEVKSHTFTKWLRKTNDIAADERSMDEAITQTRQGTIDNCLYEFNQNRLLGIGFQVSEQVKDMYQHSSGLILSAPIEKGLLPMMVLGEGGIVGATLFYAFVLAFIFWAIKGRYYASLTLFVTFFGTNIGEATFFSPGGPGGVLWAFFALGGFATDRLMAIRLKQQTRFNRNYYGVRR